MLNVGIIGLGPAWETRYRPVLKRLRDRIRVRAIYDAVANRAQLAAVDFEADVMHGIQSLIARPDVQAVLLLDQLWYGHVPLHFACKHSKPAYISGALGECLGAIRHLQTQVDRSGIDLVPEFSRRYTPATGRLRELMATRLGRPRRIRVEADFPEVHETVVIPGTETEVDFLVGLIDWCHYLVGTSPHSIHSVPISEVARELRDAVAAERSLNIDFRSSASDGEPASVCISLRKNLLRPAHTNGAPPRPRYEVHCARGRAVVEGFSNITWEVDAECHVESLAAERPDVEVMLDHFCRRVVGGLIPVPKIDDVYHALGVVHAANESHRQGCPIQLNGLYTRPRS